MGALNGDLRKLPADPDKTLADHISDLVREQQGKIEEARQANELLRSALARIAKHCEDTKVNLALPGGDSCSVVNANDIIEICKGIDHLWFDPEKGAYHGQ